MINSASAAEETRQSCKKIVDKNTGVNYFVQVAHTPSPEGPEGDYEETSFNIVLTDGAQAWTAEGVDHTVLKPASLPHRVKHALEAFTDLLPASEEYSYELSLKVESAPELWARWIGRHGKSMSYTVRAPLRAAGADSGRHISAVLTSLLANLDSARASSAALEAQCREWQGAAQRSQGLVEQYVEHRKEQEREMSQKVAALLNSKKQKLRELRREMEALRAGGPAADTGAADVEEDAEPADSGANEEDDEGLEVGPSMAGVCGLGGDDSQGEQGLGARFDLDQSSPLRDPDYY